MPHTWASTITFTSEAIAFSSGNDLLCFRLMTLMLIRMCLLHRLLVSVSQKSFEGFLSTEPFVVCCFLITVPSSDCFYACGILPTCPILIKCSMVETELRISHFQKEKVYPGFKESPKLPFSVNGYHYSLSLSSCPSPSSFFFYPQVLYVPAASTATVLGSTKKVFKFGH